MSKKDAEKAKAGEATAEKEAAETTTAKKEAYEKDAEAITSCSRSAHQTLKSYWSCDESFATDDQGFISEHYCAKPSPDPDRNRQWFLRNQR